MRILLVNPPQHILTGAGTMLQRRITIIILIATALAIRPAVAQTPCEIGWTAPVFLSPDSSVPTIPSMAVSGDTVHLTWFGLDTTAGGVLSRSGLCYARSTDGGATFSEPVKFLSPFESIPGQLAVRGSTVFVTAGAFLPDFVGIVLFTSTDAGATWSGPAPVRPLAFPELLFADRTGLILGYRDIESSVFGILASFDDGATWQQRIHRIGELAAMASFGPGLFAVGPAPGASQTEAGFYESVDTARSWFGPTLVSPEDLVRSSYPSVSINGAGDIFCAWIDTGAVIFRSSRNLGLSWGGWTRLSEEAGSISVRVASGGSFVAVAWDRDVGGAKGVRLRVSPDSGKTFCPALSPDGSPSAREPVIAIVDSAIHVAWIEDQGGSSGVYYRKGFLPGGGQDGGLPDAYALRQSYPNPTNGRAFVGFDVPEDADLTLRIYNVLGELVMTPAAGRYARGRYEVPVEVGGLASGVYYYRLTGPRFSGAGRMVVVR